MTPNALYDKLTKCDVDKTIHQAIEGETAALIDLNRYQLKKCIPPDGGRIGRYASESYARLKNMMNPAAGKGNVDVYYTGNFVSDMVAEVSATHGEIDIFSRDEKMDVLDEKYPGRIFGLTNDNRAKFRDIFYKRFKEIVKQVTGL